MVAPVSLRRPHAVKLKIHSCAAARPQYAHRMRWFSMDWHGLQIEFPNIIACNATLTCFHSKMQAKFLFWDVNNKLDCSLWVGNSEYCYIHLQLFIMYTVKIESCSGGIFSWTWIMTTSKEIRRKSESIYFWFQMCTHYKNYFLTQHFCLFDQHKYLKHSKLRYLGGKMTQKIKYQNCVFIKKYANKELKKLVL